MFTKSPLLPIRADQRLMVLDESRQLIVKAALERQNILMVGGPGSGKTSLLNAIKMRADDGPAELLMIYLNARGAVDSFQLLHQLLREATENEWVPPGEEPGRDDPFAIAAMLRRLRDAPENTMVLLDDPSPEQTVTMFGRFRDEVWRLPIRFVVAVSEQAALAAAAPPVDAFFDKVFLLEPLPVDDALELLRRRKHAGQMEGTIVPPRAAMQPRAVLLDAEAGPSGVRHDAELQSQLLQRASDTAGRAGAMLFTEIWNGGAVSASDEALQKRLGVTRSRLTQLLKELEREGVLAIVDGPSQGSVGRPKVWYDVRRTP